MKKIFVFIFLMFFSLPVFGVQNTSISARSVKPDINEAKTLFLNTKLQFNKNDSSIDISADSSVFVLGDVDYTDFMEDLGHQVAKFWHPNEMPETSMLEMLLKINKRGELVSYKVLTGNEILSKSAVEAVKNAFPFMNLPQEAHQKNIFIKFTFVYNAENKPEVKNVDFKPYMSELQKKIKKNWKPNRWSKKSKLTILLFSINKQGELVSCEISKSSGDNEFDKLALKAVRDTAPFKSLPKEYNGEKIDIQFTFDYNVWGEKNSVQIDTSLLNCKITDKSPSNHTYASFNDRNKRKVFKSYMNDVTKMLETIKYNGEKASLVKIKFIISKSGEAQNIKVTASTGNKEFNNNVINQIKGIDFGSIPEELGVVNIPVEYQFDNYTYNSELTKQLYKSSKYSGINTGAGVVGAGSLLGIFILKLVGY